MHVGRDSVGHDVLTLSGPEPDSQWRRFADVVSTLAVELNVSKMVALGAYPFATPHTRDPRLSSSSPSAEVVANVPYLKNSVDVPAGMGAVLEHAFTEKGMPALGIWAQVPHYVSAMSYPAATLALLTGLHDVTGLVIDAVGGSSGEHRPAPAAGSARGQQRRAPVHGRPARGAVRPSATADPTLLGTGGMPTGDELAAEFERFLRDQES